MLQNGLWSVEVATNLRTIGSGVAVLNWPQILGGDACYLYVGTIQQHDDEIEVRVRMKHYRGPPITVFNVPAGVFNILARGKVEAPNELWLAGNVYENPALEVTLQLTHRHDLI